MMGLLDGLKFTLVLWVVLRVSGGVDASEVEGNEASLLSVGLLSVALAGVCLAVVSVFAMVCCGFLKRRSRSSKTNEDDDDPETLQGNAAAGNDVRMVQQSRSDIGVTVEPKQTTSFILQSEVVRVESNGPHKKSNASLNELATRGAAPVAHQGIQEFKNRSNSLASLGTIGREGVEAVTLVSRDNDGIGLTIEGGSDDGVIVKDVHHDGPAAESRRINAGDRIVSMAICMEKMTLEHAETLFQLARLYPVELHFVKGGLPKVAPLPSEPTDGSTSGDLMEERGRSQSASCLPAIDEDLHEAARLDSPDRPSSSLTHLPLPGQISRWRNDAELSPEVKLLQSSGSKTTFEDDIAAMSELASTQTSGDEGFQTVEAYKRVDAMNPPHDGGKHHGEHELSVDAVVLFPGRETPEDNWKNERRGKVAASEAAADSDDEEDDAADRVHGTGRGGGMMNKGRQLKVLDGGEQEDEPLAEPTLQSDFKIDLPHLGGDGEGSRSDAGMRSEGVVAVEGKGLVVTPEFHNIDGAHQNDRDSFHKRGNVGFDSSTHWNNNSSHDTDNDEDENTDDQTTTTTVSIENVRTTEGTSWNSSHVNSEEVGNDAEMIGVTSDQFSTKVDVDRRAALSFGAKAERGKASYNDQGEHVSHDVEVHAIHTDVVVGASGIASAKSDLLDPSGTFGSPVHSHNGDDHGYDSANTSVSLDGRNHVGVVVGQGIRRSPEGEQREQVEETVKVVRKGQTVSYYERFCETVETGLPGAVVDLDAVDEGHEEEVLEVVKVVEVDVVKVEVEEVEKERTSFELSSEVKKHEEIKLGSAPHAAAAALSVNGSSVQESTSVPPQVSGGTVSPSPPPTLEVISVSSGSKQSPPAAKSIGSRLKGFFSPKKGAAKDKERGESSGNEETSVRANDFTYSSAQKVASTEEAGPTQRSAEDTGVSTSTGGAPGPSKGFVVGLRGAPQQGVPKLSGEVIPSNGEHDGYKVEEVEAEDDGAAWARSYSVNVGVGDSATTTDSARRVLDFSTAPGKGSVDEEEATETEKDLVEEEYSDRKSNAVESDYDIPRKLYITSSEKREEVEGTAHGTQNGTGTSPSGSSDVPGFVFDGKDFNEFYYGMAFYGKDKVTEKDDDVKDKTEKLDDDDDDDDDEQMGHRVEPVGTERDNKRVNGIGGNSRSEPQSSLSTVPPSLQHQQLEVSSDDEDEVISYSSTAQTTTRLPVDDLPPPQGRFSEHGKETRDRVNKSADLPTSNRPDTFEFLDLNQFSLEPLELPSWESLGLSPQRNGLDGGAPPPPTSSHGSNAAKYKTKEITSLTIEDQNNNALIDSSNA